MVPYLSAGTVKTFTTIGIFYLWFLKVTINWWWENNLIFFRRGDEKIGFNFHQHQQHRTIFSVYLLIFEFIHHFHVGTHRNRCLMDKLFNSVEKFHSSLTTFRLELQEIFSKYQTIINVTQMFEFLTKCFFPCAAGVVTTYDKKGGKLELIRKKREKRRICITKLHQKQSIQRYLIKHTLMPRTEW